MKTKITTTTCKSSSKHTLHLILLVLFTGMVLTTTMPSCNKPGSPPVEGAGKASSETRKPGNFTAVKLKGYGQVAITQGNELSLVITDFPNLLPYVETTVSNNQLLVGYKDNVNIRNGNLSVTIVMPSLNGTSIDGAGNFTVNGNFITKGVFSSWISGAGKIQVNGGSADSLDAGIDGGGALNEAAFAVKTASVKISGSGSADVKVSDRLDVNIDGSGIVYYTGSPVINQHISGIGKVTKR